MEYNTNTFMIKRNTYNICKLEYMLHTSTGWYFGFSIISAVYSAKLTFGP